MFKKTLITAALAMTLGTSAYAADYTIDKTSA